MVVRLLVQSAVWFALMAVCLFLPAGTMSWTAGWIFLAEMAIPGLAMGLWLARRDPGLLKERLAPLIQRRQPWADRLLMAVLIPLWIGWLAAMGHWHAAAPAWLAALGAVFVMIAMIVSGWTFRANSYAAAVVRIQGERGHRLVSDGPYRFVRHPMYAGVLFLFAGAPMLLGSWQGLALVPLLVVLLGVRILIEERTLRAGLEGYEDYARKVRYRLVPGVW